MTKFINQAIIQGNLGSDPITRTSKKGNKFVTFSVATQTQYTNQQGEDKKFVEWHNIVVFDDFLSLLARGNFKKGDLVYIKGSLATDKKEDETGKTYYKTQIVVRNSKLHKISKVE